MFEKRKLRKQIKKAKEAIVELEQKRARSQAALIDALLKNEDPDDMEVDYFNQFSGKINGERERLRALTEEYEALTKK
jgi:hypothetical protein